MEEDEEMKKALGKHGSHPLARSLFYGKQACPCQYSTASALRASVHAFLVRAMVG